MAFLLTAVPAWLATRDTTQWLLVPGTLVGVGVVVLAWAYWPTARKNLVRELRRRIGLTALEQRVKAVEDANVGLALDVEEQRHQADRQFRQGLTEGLKRAAGLPPPTTALPTDLFVAVGGSDLTLVGSTTRSRYLKPGARMTAAARGTGEPIGVLEVIKVTDEGDVLLRCVDRLVGSYWDRLGAGQGGEPLTGIRLVKYDYTAHHSVQPIDSEEQA